jgi:cellobiose-specific phosphotransferase system component IIA
LDSYAYQLPKDVDNVPEELRKGINAYKADQIEQATKLLKEPIYNEILSPINEKLEYGSSKGIRSEKDKLNLDTNKEALRHLYLGLSLLKNNQIDKALSEIAKAKTGDTKSSAEWYEALCFLKLKQMDKAKKILVGIASNSQNPYEADANEILNALN